jgi:uncharacterized protein YjiS (DUF1127 family)
MNPVSTPSAPEFPRLHSVLRAAMQVIPARLRRAMSQWQERRDDEAVRRTLCTLDDRTLHDLGFNRAEIGSVCLRNDLTRPRQIRAGL